MEIIRDDKVHPSQTAAPTTKALSIVDTAASMYTCCSAIWLYDKSDQLDSRNASFYSLLTASLQEALSLWPAWAGQVHWDQRLPTQVGRRTAGRLLVSYGNSTDPGVGLVHAQTGYSLADVCPSVNERKTTKQIWQSPIKGSLSLESLVPQKAIVIMDDFAATPGSIAAAVQLTGFACGGWALGLNICHVLADASAMAAFVRDWSLRTRTSQGDASATLKAEEPVFEPQLLDRHAEPVGLGPPNQERTRLAYSLPMHRYDRWNMNAEGFHDWARSRTAACKALLPAELREYPVQADLPPWKSWDPSRECAHVQIRFSAEELAGLQEAADAVAGPSVRVSKQDALLAHLWSVVNRARGLGDSTEPVFLDFTLGLRTRVDPPLPSTFVGSATMIGYLEKPAKEAAAIASGHNAVNLRQTLQRFTPEAVAAYLHEAAHQESLQRLWRGGFMGNRHLLVTSWVRLGAYDIHFDGSRRDARYVQGIMPCIDGLLALYDLPGEQMEIDVGLDLEISSLERVLADDHLHPTSVKGRVHVLGGTEQGKGEAMSWQ